MSIAVCSCTTNIHVCCTNDIAKGCKHPINRIRCQWLNMQLNVCMYSAKYSLSWFAFSPSLNEYFTTAVAHFLWILNAELQFVLSSRECANLQLENHFNLITCFTLRVLRKYGRVCTCAIFTYYRSMQKLAEMRCTKCKYMHAPCISHIKHINGIRIRRQFPI